MTIAGRAERRLAVFLFGSLLVGHLGCHSTAADRGEKLCASACAGWVRGCGIAAAPCIQGCESARALAASERCQREHAAYLACLSAAPVACEPPPSPRVAFSHGGPGRECAREFARYSRCSEPCRERGVVRSGSRELSEGGRKLAVSAELVAMGCGPGAPEPARKAPPGARCEAASVCSGFRCECPESPAGYLARACIDGSCADAERACRLVPRATAHDACRRNEGP